MEYKSIHDMSKRTHTPNDATKQMLAQPMGVFNCPSRRTGRVSGIPCSRCNGSAYGNKLHED